MLNKEVMDHGAQYPNAETDRLAAPRWTAPATAGRRVLAVDPDPLVQVAYATLLQRVGFEVQTADQIEAALEPGVLADFDVIVIRATALGATGGALLDAVQDGGAHISMVLTAGGPHPGMDPKAAEYAGMLIVLAIQSGAPVSVIRIDREFTQAFAL